MGLRCGHSMSIVFIMLQFTSLGKNCKCIIMYKIKNWKCIIMYIIKNCKCIIMYIIKNCKCIIMYIIKNCKCITKKCKESLSNHFGI